jgi:hypothetical protein
LQHHWLREAVGTGPEAAVEVAALAEFADDEAEGTSVENVQQADGVRRVAGLLAADLVIEQQFLVGSLEDLAIDYLHAHQLVALSVHPHVGIT